MADIDVNEQLNEETSSSTDTSNAETVETFDYLSKLKLMLGISDNKYDSILQLYLDITKNSILNFCNINELPSSLNYTLISITVDTYLDNELKQGKGNVNGTVSSISEDGRSVSFSSGTEFKTSVEDKIAKTKELFRYRKLYRI